MRGEGLGGSRNLDLFRLKVLAQLLLGALALSIPNFLKFKSYES